MPSRSAASGPARIAPLVHPRAVQGCGIMPALPKMVASVHDISGRHARGSLLETSLALLCTVITVVLAVALAAGCTAAEGRLPCRVAADCASGVCSALGECVPAAGDGGLVLDVLPIDGQVAGDTGTDGAPGDGDPAGDGTTSGDGPGSDGPRDDGGTVVCSPNGDGVIDAQEVPLRAGLHATFRVAQDTAINTAGVAGEDGRRRWDLGVELDGDHGMRLETQSLEGRWYETVFPGATYAARLSESQDLLGIFEVTAAALLLRGVVSPEDGFYRTELTYDPPVEVLRFPLSVGASYGNTSTVSGLAVGVAAAYTEQYEQTVDAEGDLVTPYGEFEVLRIGVTLTRTIGFVPTVVRTYLVVAECFGTVATIVSRDNETSKEFTEAAEVRRLAP